MWAMILLDVGVIVYTVSVVVYCAYEYVKEEKELLHNDSSRIKSLE